MICKGACRFVREKRTSSPEQPTILHFSAVHECAAFFSSTAAAFSFLTVVIKHMAGQDGLFCLVIPTTYVLGTWTGRDTPHLLRLATCICLIVIS